MDRFKGMSEEEVMKKTLPDLLDYNLDYVIVSFLRQSSRKSISADHTDILLLSL